MSGQRRSRLAGAMKTKSSLATEPEPVGHSDAPAPDSPEDEGRGLAAVPEPVQEASSAPQEATDAEGPETDAEASGEEASREPGDAEPPAADEPAPVKQQPVRRKKAAPAEATASRQAQTPEDPDERAAARLKQDLSHLRLIIDTGRDQRRYVEDLPPRTARSTHIRLPAHLQDLLAEYCDRNKAPMADLITAIVDAFFRDVGALPRLGEGHQPNEEFLAKARREARTHDY